MVGKGNLAVFESSNISGRASARMERERERERRRSKRTVCNNKKIIS